MPETLGDGDAICRRDRPHGSSQPGPAVGDGMLFCGLSVSCPAGVATALWGPLCQGRCSLHFSCASLPARVCPHSLVLSQQPLEQPVTDGETEAWVLLLFQSLFQHEHQTPAPEGTGHCEPAQGRGLWPEIRFSRQTALRGPACTRPLCPSPGPLAAFRREALGPCPSEPGLAGSGQAPALGHMGSTGWVATATACMASASSSGEQRFALGALGTERARSWHIGTGSAPRGVLPAPGLARQPGPPVSRGNLGRKALQPA